MPRVLLSYETVYFEQGIVDSGARLSDQLCGEEPKIEKVVTWK